VLTTRAPIAARLAEWVVLAGIYGALLMPLVYTRATMFPFVYPKALFFQAVVDIAFPAWVALAFRDPRYRPRPSWLLGSMIAWIAAMTLATCFGENPRRSLFSYPERMTGLLSQLHVVAWFLMASGTLKTVKRWRRLLEVHLAVAFASACVVTVQLLHPTFIGASQVGQGDRLAGFLGNPIYLAAYEAFSIPFAVVLFRGARTGRRALYLLAALAAVWAMLLAGSRGPMLGLAVGIVSTVLVLGLAGQYKGLATATAVGAVVVAATYGLALAFLVGRPSMQPFWAAHRNLRHLFDFAVEPVRLGLWKAAWAGFASRPLLGWGPGGYELALDAVFRPSFHTLGIQDKAHSILLGVLCENGAIGAISYLGVWASFFVAAMRSVRNGSLTPLQGAALMGAGAGYFVQGLFAPDSTATDLTVAVAFVAVASAHATAEPHNTDRDLRVLSRLGWYTRLGLVSAVALSLLLFGSVLPFVASRYAKQAVDRTPENDSAAIIASLDRAHRFPSPYLDDRFTAITGITQGLAQANLLETWPQRAAQIGLTMAVADEYLHDNPTHARFRSHLADTLVAVGRVTDQAAMDGRAESLYRQSIAESPTRQINRFAYARFLTRLGRIPEAEDQYRKALASDPSIGESRWLLGQFLWRYLKQPDEGTRLMADAIEGDAINRYLASSPLEWVQLAQALGRQHRNDKLRALVAPLRALPNGPGPASACLEIAKLLEDAGLVAERDQVLRLGIARNPSLASTVAPALGGMARLRDGGSQSSTAP